MFIYLNNTEMRLLKKNILFIESVHVGFIFCFELLL